MRSFFAASAGAVQEEELSLLILISLEISKKY